MIECLSGCIHVFLLAVCAWVGQAATSQCNAGARSYRSSLTKGSFKIRLGQFLCSICRRFCDCLQGRNSSARQAHCDEWRQSEQRSDPRHRWRHDAGVGQSAAESELRREFTHHHQSNTSRIILRIEYYFISFLSVACCTGRVRSLTPVHTLSKKSNIRPRFPPRSLRLLPPIRLRNTKLSPVKRQILDCGEKICYAFIALAHFNLWFCLL